MRVSGPPKRGRWARFAADSLSSLSYRDFRFLLLSSTSLSFGQWFQQIGMSWLAYVVTNSPVQMGIVAAIRGVVLMVMSVPAGFLADRVDRRSLVLWSTAAAVIQAGLLAALVLLDMVQWWHLWVFAAIEGGFAAFNMPARLALVYDQVGPKTLENAVALSAVTNNLARVTGPTIAGMIIGWVGVGACFVALAALKVLAFALTIPIRPIKSAGVSKDRVHGWRGYLEGLVVVKHSRVLLGLLIVYIIPALLVYPYMAFVPIYTSDVLGLGKDASAYGFLMSAVGFGSLVGAALLATRGSGRRGGVLMLGGQFFYILMITLFAMSTWLPLAFGILVLAGLFNSYNLTMNQTLFQLNTPDEARGRVLAVYSMSGTGLQPIGNLVMGPVLAVWGFSPTVVTFTVVAAAITLLTAVVIPEVARLQTVAARAKTASRPA